MKNIILSLFLILIFIPHAQAAEKIRDMSLSVEETNELIRNAPQQPAARYDNSGTGFDDNVPLDPNMARQMREINSRTDDADFGKTASPILGMLPPQARGQNRQSYINQFCASNYAVKTTGTPSMQACMETQRQQACERFTRATVNVQHILSQAVDCELNASDYDKSGCDGLDAGRLDLLKQYWQDEDISYTILYLPDMILNSASSCTSSRNK